jgi:hypothetical protein
LKLIDRKLVVRDVPVQSGSVPVLQFKHEHQLVYRALLYELRDIAGNTSDVAPNWFGVAIPDPGNFDLSSTVNIVLYFHPRPGQAGYNDADYLNKNGANGTDWRRLYAYVDRLGGQMTAALRAGSPTRPNNRLTILPFLKNEQYTLPTSEWFNVIHDILKDINTNVVPGICTKRKQIIVATLSNGTFYLDKFLTQAAGLPDDDKIIQAWDFDTDIVIGQAAPLNPHGKRLRAYWQNPVPQNPPSGRTYIYVPEPRWRSFPQDAATLQEKPPLPPPTEAPLDRVHHYIRDTMFLDAVWNIENDNP